jgi:bifunctional ADP-heptose synthase (sugar kinase/adenylyltransferase)
MLLVTGHFDILRAELVRELSEARRRTAAQSLMAVVQAMAGELAPVASRAEMAAALRVVDYVLIAGNEELDRLTAHLQPIETIRLEEGDARCTRQLIEHVQRRQS